MYQNEIQPYIFFTFILILKPFNKFKWFWIFYLMRNCYVWNEKRHIA